MSTRMEALLKRAAISTFEELAFLYEEAAPAAADDGPGLPLRASVAFRGPWQGRLVLTTDEALLPALAANMLGTIEAPEPALQRDALGEICNVMCGQLLPALAGGEHVFRLDSPVVHGGEAAPGTAPGSVGDGELACTAAVGGFVDGGRWRLELWTVLTPAPLPTHPRRDAGP